MPKPDCYECRYRRQVPGDAHSSCHHPVFEKVHDNPMLSFMSILASAQKESIQIRSKTITVKGNPIGIRNGWFNHPINFDPTWLQKCNGFTPILAFEDKMALDS